MVDEDSTNVSFRQFSFRKVSHSNKCLIWTVFVRTDVSFGLKSFGLMSLGLQAFGFQSHSDFLPIWKIIIQTAAYSDFSGIWTIVAWSSGIRR